MYTREQLEQIGGKYWEKNSMRRVYFNVREGKFWYDFVDEKFHGREMDTDDFSEGVQNIKGRLAALLRPLECVEDDKDLIRSTLRMELEDLLREARQRGMTPRYYFDKEELPYIRTDRAFEDAIEHLDEIYEILERWA